MQAGRNRLHYRKGFVTFWTKLSGSWRLFGTDFPVLGVRFISINDGFDSKNFFGQTGGMDVAFKNFIYEMYSRDLSEKVKSGVTTCMKRGEYYAGCMVYGYKSHQMVKEWKLTRGQQLLYGVFFRSWQMEKMQNFGNRTKCRGSADQADL